MTTALVFPGQGSQAIGMAQALDMLAPLKTSAKLEKVKAAIRKHVTYLKEDRFIGPDIEAVHGLVVSGELLK